MIEIAAIIIAIDFIKFASSLVGEAIKTTINKNIELKLEDRYKNRNDTFVKSYNKNNDKLLVQKCLLTNEGKNWLKLNKRCNLNKKTYYSPKTIYASDKKPFVILRLPQANKKDYCYDIANKLRNIDGIHFADTNRFDDTMNELLEVPVIIIDIKNLIEQQVICDITIWNIIPGLNNAQTLQLCFDSLSFQKDLQNFYKKVEDYIITIIRLLKDAFVYCRLSLNDSLERLKIESNILYEMGYNQIEFYKKNSGYFAQLSGVFDYEILIHLTNEYPYFPPTILIKKGGSFENIEITDDLWTPDCTIGQLISTINENL